MGVEKSRGEGSRREGLCKGIMGRKETQRKRTMFYRSLRCKETQRAVEGGGEGGQSTEGPSAARESDRMWAFDRQEMHVG